MEKFEKKENNVIFIIDNYYFNEVRKFCAVMSTICI